MQLRTGHAPLHRGLPVGREQRTGAEGCLGSWGFQGPSVLYRHIARRVVHISSGQRASLPSSSEPRVEPGPPLNKYLHRIRSTESPLCPACKDSEETVHHFITACPAYRTHRETLQRSTPNRAFHIRRLLSKDESIHTRPAQVYRRNRKTRTRTFGNIIADN
ncbi:hypothetical protein BDR03DRAFT_896099 [Suillus americanus]|nr:hypothetical protein BDR03DRAFT_896099 [Suillus americanus]